jgi:hypothetical protein
MGLREQAALDSQAILEDATSGFGWPFTLTSPAGVVTVLVGYTTDVAVTIDPETGQAVSGRKASVAVSIRSLPALPVAVAETAERPWLVRFADIQGVSSTWKVIDALPDRAVGVVVLLLESYAGAD